MFNLKRHLLFLFNIFKNDASNGTFSLAFEHEYETNSDRLIYFIYCFSVIQNSIKFYSEISNGNII